MEMAETEKITVNMNVVDLGKADLLVDQGFYSNRTDFIKTAIRNQLNSHSMVVDNVIQEKAFAIGMIHYSRKELEGILAQNKMLDIRVVGMLVLNEDISLDLAIRTIRSLKVFGVLKASRQLKDHLEQS